MSDDSSIGWSLVSVTGRISGRVGVGSDGILRFSVRNGKAAFYTQCRQDEVLDERLLKPNAGVWVTGRLVSFYSRNIRRHIPAIRALSICVFRNGKCISILRKFEITDRFDIG